MKYFKIIGNLATVIALIFIALRIASYDIDWKGLVLSWNILFYILLSLFQCLIMYAYKTVWAILVRTFSQQQKLSKSKAAVSYIYLKANIMKYIPGNVFQYIGRNELAVFLDVKHADLAFASVSEVVLIVLSVGLASLLLTWSAVIEFLKTHRALLLIEIISGIIVILLLCFLYIRKKSIREYFYNLRKTLLAKKNIKTVLFCFVSYLFVALMNAILFTALFQFISKIPVSIQNIRIVMGSHMLSWLAGYITPGSPGGIGVRELILLSTLQNNITTEKIVLQASVLSRIISILGDLLAYASSFLIYKMRREE